MRDACSSRVHMLKQRLRVAQALQAELEAARQQAELAGAEGEAARAAQEAEGAEALATSSRDAHQCIRFSDTCYGVQFLPEFDSEVMRGYVEARSELITAEGLDAEAMLARASDTPMGGQVLRNFVRHFLGSGASEA